MRRMERMAAQDWHPFLQGRLHRLASTALTVACMRLSSLPFHWRWPAFTRFRRLSLAAALLAAGTGSRTRIGTESRDFPSRFDRVLCSTSSLPHFLRILGLFGTICDPCENWEIWKSGAVKLGQPKQRQASN